jgi:hypothetical protein
MENPLGRWSRQTSPSTVFFHGIMYVLRSSTSAVHQVSSGMCKPLDCSQRACSLTSLEQEEPQNNQKACGYGYPLISASRRFLPKRKVD